ncbi:MULTISPECIES: cytochrome c oxidase assembly protein [unclassified Micrococcus]|uniref:cytochrome c oxidase assembly protein n=1 Tax=unclassified Micrococcus TaxID=2620948 RepID=UPI0020046D91|nr:MULTISPECIES: cytochrome c oxidase assembly protein [unclassified Micrococcus]
MPSAPASPADAPASAAPRSTDPRTVGRVGVPAWVWPVAAAAGVLALVLTAWLTGVSAARALSDPGPITRWGVPLATAVSHTAMALTIGATILAAGILPPHAAGAERRHRSGAQRRADAAAGPLPEHPAFAGVMQVAAWAAGTWTVAALAVGILSYSDLAGIPVTAGQGFTDGLLAYAASISVGRAWFWVTVIAAVVTTLVIAVRSHSGLFWTGILAMLAIVPLALIGHAAGGDDHYGAVNSIGLHLIGVVTWVGGLLALAAISSTLTGPNGAQGHGASTRRQGPAPLLHTVVSRYSLLAGLGLVTVVLSGIVNAALRMEHLSQLASPYGLVVVAKAVAAVVLGAIGLVHRRSIIPRLGADGEAESPAAARRLLWQLIAVEAVIMAAVMGVSAVLARTAPPKPEELAPDATPARILTGYEMPPELTPERWFTLWRFDWLWVAIIAFLAVWYVRSTLQLHRRGDRWPVLRTLSWLTGLAVLLWATSGAPAVYGMVLFSAHMVGHMTLTMIVPLFLVMGAPITLALRALPSRTDGTRGPREWILWIVHSPWGRFITNPIVAGVNFAGSILVFYYTDFFRFALEEHVGHEFMNVHFLLTGFIFALVMVGSDPLPDRPAYPLRLVLLLATMVFHAFIGVAMTSSTGLLQASWFGNLGRDWGPPALEDQRIGGGIMWGIGEFPTVAMAVTVAVLWYRSDTKNAVRLDRKADRDGDAELNAWNAMYANLNHAPAPADGSPSVGAPPVRASAAETPAAESAGAASPADHLQEPQHGR